MAKAKKGTNTPKKFKSTKKPIEFKTKPRPNAKRGEDQIIFKRSDSTMKKKKETAPRSPGFSLGAKQQAKFSKYLRGK